MNRREFIKSLAVTCALGTQAPRLGAAEAIATKTDSSKLPHRPLGKTGALVSALALGGVIGMQLPPSAEHDPAALAETALDMGITYFDTAPSYNNGQSETNYGQVLARRRKGVFLATKTESRTYDGTMRGLEQSLKRLRTDHVDLIQIHGISANEDLAAWDKPDGVLAALRKLREQKVTRFIGLTGHDSAAKLRQAIEMYELDTLLTTLNPVTRRQPFREELLPVANQKQMGVIAMKVMGGGNGCLVTGNPLNKVLRPYHDQTSHQVAPPHLLRYTLGLPISVAVVGVATVEQLKGNVAIVKEMVPMTLAERKDLEQAMA
ncbi:MAG TPA: aldo/keto reductase [Candidatus Binatia bacterium]|jgi:aryl-alcohol dehydrogenase-like predicted oxidoreductase|nr:aldo/keto reductase [Candidatus Binatia bacterium]